MSTKIKHFQRRNNGGLFDGDAFIDTHRRGRAVGGADLISFDIRLEIKETTLTSYYLTGITATSTAGIKVVRTGTEYNIYALSVSDSYLHKINNKKINLNEIYNVRVEFHTNVDSISTFLMDEYGNILCTNTYSSACTWMNGSTLGFWVGARNNNGTSLEDKAECVIYNFSHFNGTDTTNLYIYGEVTTTPITIIDTKGIRNGDLYTTGSLDNFFAKETDLSDIMEGGLSIQRDLDKWRRTKDYTLDLTFYDPNNIINKGDSFKVEVDGEDEEILTVIEIIKSTNNINTVKCANFAFLWRYYRIPITTYVWASGYQQQFLWWSAFNPTRSEWQTNKEWFSLSYFLKQSYFITQFDRMFSSVSIDYGTSNLYYDYNTSTEVANANLIISENQIRHYEITEHEPIDLALMIGSFVNLLNDIFYSMSLIYYVNNNVLTFCRLDYSEDTTIIEKRGIAEREENLKSDIKISIVSDFTDYTYYPNSAVAPNMNDKSTITGKTDEYYQNFINYIQYSFGSNFWLFHRNTTTDDIEHFYYNNENQNFINQIAVIKGTEMINKKTFEEFETANIKKYSNKYFKYKARLNYSRSTLTTTIKQIKE